MKPRETRADHRFYNNVVGLIFLNAIAQQYSMYATDSGEALEKDEEEYITSLYTKHGHSIVSYLISMLYAISAKRQITFYIQYNFSKNIIAINRYRQ